MTPSRDRAGLFLELLEPIQAALEGYCRRMLRDRSLVEDVLQSALARALAKFDRYAEGTNFKAWMFRFVTLEIFNCNRKHEAVASGEVPVDLSAEESWGLVRLEETFDAMLDDPDVVLEHFDDVIVDFLKTLPPLERAVLLLRSIGDFSYREIQELLSIPLGSVIGYLSRAKKRLRIALADYAVERGLLGRGGHQRFAGPPGEEP